jgi:twitching motility protein PilT
VQQVQGGLLLYAIITQKQREKFEEELELDFAYSMPGRPASASTSTSSATPSARPSASSPSRSSRSRASASRRASANFADLPRGFVLVTGPTGSGKSTTLAALVDLINRTPRPHHDRRGPDRVPPPHKSCLVNQREVGEDTHGVRRALKHVLRQDPDIILVGEMRDLETIQIALTAAETGHLVFGPCTPRTPPRRSTASSTSSRPPAAAGPRQLWPARCRASSARQLCKTADGKGRVVATEVMVATPAIRNLIREGKTHQIYSAMQAGAQHGMHTMDQHLAELVKKGKVTYETRRWRSATTSRTSTGSSAGAERRLGPWHRDRDVRVQGPRPRRAARHRQARRPTRPGAGRLQAQEMGYAPLKITRSTRG